MFRHFYRQKDNNNQWSYQWLFMVFFQIYLTGFSHITTVFNDQKGFELCNARFKWGETSRKVSLKYMNKPKNGFDICVIFVIFDKACHTSL